MATMNQQMQGDMNISDEDLSGGSFDSTEKFEQMEAYLFETDYHRGAPGGIASSCDGEACAEFACEECGHEGLQYKPFTKAGSYRAFAVCPECGNYFEF